MELDFRPLKQPHAVAILDWHYPAPYDVYNFKPAQRQTDLDSLLNPQNNFSVILNEDGDLEGFCSFGPDGQVPGGNYREPALDIGLGIRPDLTGQSNGRRYAQNESGNLSASVRLKPFTKQIVIRPLS
jgi:ribosomal-protein-alanine N-acetyltransferase